MLSEQQISTLEWYLKNHVTQKMLKIQLCITEINYILTYIQIENSYLKLQYYFAILLILLYFNNKCSLGEQKRVLLKRIYNLYSHKWLATAPGVCVCSLLCVCVCVCVLGWVNTLYVLSLSLQTYQPQTSEW